MNTPSVRVPVTQEVLDMVFEVMKAKKLTLDMLGVERSQNPAEIIFVTSGGRVPCQVKEVGQFICIELPSGRRPSPGFVKQHVIAQAWFYRGEAYETSGQTTNAIAAYRRAVKTMPDFDFAWCTLALLYEKSGQTTNAIAAYRKAIKIWPENAKAWCGLGLSYQKSGRTEDAFAAYRKAVNIEPDNAALWYALGKAHELSGHASEAAAALAEARRLNPELPIGDV